MNLKSLIPTYHPINSKMIYKYRFTVFTPVYNRANTIHRVFHSLNKQTFKDFELLIINDGSSDGSHNTIIELIKTAKFKVNYINSNKNQHKMARLIQGIDLAEGEFFLPFDSDDECTEKALQTFNDTYVAIPDDLKKTISSITCLCQDQNGHIVGEKFETSPLYSSTFQNILKGKYQLEKWGFMKTKILKGITVNENLYSKGYIPEGILWALLSKHKFKTVYINDILRTYYLDTGNRVSNQNHKKDAFGMMIYSLSILNWFYKDYFFTNPKVFIKRVYTLLRAAWFLDFSKKDYLKALDSYFIKLLFIAGWPFKRLFSSF